MKTWTPETPFPFWLLKSRPGEVYTYHRGLLLSDRHPPQEGEPTSAEIGKARIIEAIADMAWTAMERGQVALRQMRHAEFDWTYQAVRL